MVSEHSFNNNHHFIVFAMQDLIGSINFSFNLICIQEVTCSLNIVSTSSLDGHLKYEFQNIPKK